MRTPVLLAALAAASLTVLASCSSSGNDGGAESHKMPGMTGSMSGASMSSSNHSGGMDDGMGDMPMSSGTGLSAASDGYTLTLKSQLMSGMAMPLTFVIAKEGKPVTDFDREQTKLMHFYLIRSDLTGFQHLHPTMAADGTWSVTPSAPTPGSYRIYTQFLPHGRDDALVLSRPTSVGGSAPSSPLPSPGTSAAADGYTVSIAGEPKAGEDSELRLTFTRAGKAVTGLQPYLDTYAHVTAIHQGDLAFAHLHPDTTASNDTGGPRLTLHADLPEAGNYRVFIQFQTDGTLHTASVTLTVA